jgi:RimJ/RimL family protein N-acetyltransferase
MAEVGAELAAWQQPLFTERLCVRVETPDDADALYELFADPVVMGGLGREPLTSLQDARAMIEGGVRAWEAEGLGPFVLETAAGRVVGRAGVMLFDRRDWTPSTWAAAGDHAQPELGWSLARMHWGQGYATEGAAAIRDWAFQRRSLACLVSLIAPDNLRSQRVAARLGASPAETVLPAATLRATVVWSYPPSG